MTTLEDKNQQNSQSSPIQDALDHNLTRIKNTFGGSSDLLIRNFEVKVNKTIQCALIGIDGLIDSKQSEQFILRAMMQENDNPIYLSGSEKIVDYFIQSRLAMIDTKKEYDFNKLIVDLLNAHVILLIDGECEFVSMDCKGFQIRSVSEPTTETSVRGPKDAFIENMRVNTALIRWRIKDSRLRIDPLVVGEITQTDISIVYLDGVIDPKYVEMAKNRINNLKIDGLVDSSKLMQLIEDEAFTFFPRLIATERPDKVCADILEGRLAIVVDGSPFVIQGPATFVTNLQAVDDYYSRPAIATFVRLLRYVSFWLVVLLPGLYIAVSTFHQEMIPTVLLITLINQRSANPFPTIVETLVILILFDIIREASARKPSSIGDSLTIVGSLIIGQTIVQAGLVSYLVIIIGSLTAVSSFVLSSRRINNSARILTYIFVALGATLGFFGIILGILMLLIHMSSLSSFGVPYLSTYGPFNLHDQEDGLVRLPFKWMRKRPKSLNPLNVVRSQNTQISKENES